MSLEKSETLHANCVAIDGKGLLILGASGAGKSTLTLQLVALGAHLVSDDRTIITSDGLSLRAEAPFAIKGLIEVRGVGILTVPSVSGVTLTATVDLDQLEIERLPINHKRPILGVSLSCLNKMDGPAFPIALLHYVKNGRQDVE